MIILTLFALMAIAPSGAGSEDLKKGENSGSSDKDMRNILDIHLRNEKMKQILYAILDKPGIVNQELSIKFNLDKSTIHDYLKKLSREGIIEVKKDGKFKKYYLKQEVKILLIRYSSSSKSELPIS